MRAWDTGCPAEGVKGALPEILVGLPNRNPRDRTGTELLTARRAEDAPLVLNIL